MNHAWRPVILIGAAALFMLTARMFLVPSDFKAKNGDYKYQWHRLSGEEFWHNFPIKHRGREFCSQCHAELAEKVKGSGHKNVQCESCHAQFNPEKKGHPINLKEDFGYLLDIGIDRSRDLCKRCHTKLPYRPAVYTLPIGPDQHKPDENKPEQAKTIQFKMIDPTTHNAGVECVTCHDVHKTGFKAGIK